MATYNDYRQYVPFTKPASYGGVSSSFWTAVKANPIHAGYTVVEGDVYGSTSESAKRSCIKTWLECKEISVDTENNTSSVDVYMYAQWVGNPNGNWITVSGLAMPKLDGTRTGYMQLGKINCNGVENVYDSKQLSVNDTDGTLYTSNDGTTDAVKKWGLDFNYYGALSAKSNYNEANAPIEFAHDTFVIAHDKSTGEGTATISASFEFKYGSTAPNIVQGGNASTTIALTKIDVKKVESSTLSISGDANYGKSLSFQITRQPSGIVHTTTNELVEYSLNNGTSWSTCKARTNNVTSFDFMPLDYNSTPQNGSSTSVKFRITTFADTQTSQPVGNANVYDVVITYNASDSSYNFSVSGNPSITFANQIGGKNVIGKTSISAISKGTLTAQPKYNATVDTTYGTNGYLITLKNASVGSVINSADAKWEVTSCDTRGKVSSVLSQSIPTVYVAPPTITGAVVYRANASGTPDENGTYIFANVTASSDKSNISTNNAVIKAKISSASWSSAVTIPNGVNTKIAENVSDNETYSFNISVSDLVYTNADVRTAYVGGKSIEFNLTRYGLGIGMYTDADASNKKVQIAPDYTFMCSKNMRVFNDDGSDGGTLVDYLKTIFQTK